MKFLINFKTYLSGKNVLALAKTIERIDKKIIVGVSPVDVYSVSKNTKLEVFCQHVDADSPGRATGFIVPESVKASGARGVFLNHSEHGLSFDVLKKTIERCKSLKLQTAVFFADIYSGKIIEKLKPDYLIYEPVELVGGNISVSSAKPEIIEKLKKALKMDFLVGAGIKTREDVKKSLELGANGVAVSSVITTAKNPGKILKSLIN